MLLKILHFLGLTNLSDEQVDRFEQKKQEQPLFSDGDFRRPLACGEFPWPLNILCVEVAYKDGYVAIRSSADKNKTAVVFTHEEWMIFIKGVKAGEFDF